MLYALHRAGGLCWTLRFSLHSRPRYTVWGKWGRGQAGGWSPREVLCSSGQASPFREQGHGWGPMQNLTLGCLVALLLFSNCMVPWETTWLWCQAFGMPGKSVSGSPSAGQSSTWTLAALMHRSRHMPQADSMILWQSSLVQSRSRDMRGL